MGSCTQENGEVVLCIGSCVSAKNLSVFASADCSAAVLPKATLPKASVDLAALPASASADALRNLELWQALVSLCCCIQCGEEWDIQRMLDLIARSRLLLRNMNQVLVFALFACGGTFLMLWLPTCCLMAPLLTPSQVLWIVWGLIPALSLSLLFAPMGPDIMTEMPLKNQEHLSDASRLAIYFLVRSVPSVLVCMLLFCEITAALVPATGDQLWITHHLMVLSDEAGLASAQESTFTFFSLYLIVHSAGFVHRVHSFAVMPPHSNRSWLGTATALVAITCLNFARHCARYWEQVSQIGHVVWGLGAAWIVIAVFIGEVCRYHDRRKWQYFHKLRHAEFNTKLGRYSPIQH